jgi:hypothetical protein
MFSEKGPKYLGHQAAEPEHRCNDTKEVTRRPKYSGPLEPLRVRLGMQGQTID